jgi:adenylate cyclase
VNLAARLCGVAQAGQIVVPERVVWAVHELVEAEAIGTFELKGFKRPVGAYNVVRMKA